MPNLKVVSNEQPKAVDNAQRDREIYEESLGGKSNTQIAAKFGLSSTRIADIIRKVERKAKRDADRAQIAALSNDEWLNVPIERLQLSVRLFSCLRNDGIKTPREVLECTETELLRTPNFGPKTIIELKELFAERGFKIGQFAEAGKAKREARILREEVKELRAHIEHVRADQIASLFSAGDADSILRLCGELATLKANTAEEFRRISNWHDRFVPFITDINNRLTALERVLLKSLADKE